MPATLTPQARRVDAATAAALNLAGQLTALTDIPRRYVAELIVVRLFSLFEAVVEDSACRMVCGAAYCDGSAPTLQRSRPTRSFDQARDEIRNYGRGVPRFIRWNKGNEIASNMEKLFPATENFTTILLGHSSFINDLRRIRNHIAHGSAGTHRHFQNVVASYYGAKVPGLTPGRMLLSARFKPMLLDQFCRQTGAVLKASIRG